jgi:hypothetical protein
MMNRQAMATFLIGRFGFSSVVCSFFRSDCVTCVYSVKGGKWHQLVCQNDPESDPAKEEGPSRPPARSHQMPGISR